MPIMPAAMQPTSEMSSARSGTYAAWARDSGGHRTRESGPQGSCDRASCRRVQWCFACLLVGARFAKVHCRNTSVKHASLETFSAATPRLLKVRLYQALNRIHSFCVLVPRGHSPGT